MKPKCKKVTQVINYVVSRWGDEVFALELKAIRDGKLADVLWNRTAEFLSSHSFWIYLWYIIPFIFLMRHGLWSLHWSLRFLLAVGEACAIVAVRSFVVKWVKKMGVKKEVVGFLEG